MTLTMIPAEEVESIWGTVGPMLEKALLRTKGRGTLKSVLQDLKSMDQTLWVSTRDGKVMGCATVRIMEHSSGMRSLLIENLAGCEFATFGDEGHRVLSDYAKHYGCKKLECEGRVGWTRVLKKYGYEPYAVKYETSLEN